MVSRSPVSEPEPEAASSAPATLAEWLSAVPMRVVRALRPFVVLLIVWWAVKLLFDPPERVLVAPNDVGTTGLDLVANGLLVAYSALSLERLAIGCLLAVVIGVPVGLALGASRYISIAFEPFFRFLQGVSGIAWLPMAIIWFGFSETTIYVVIVYTAVVPIAYNAMLGLQTINPVYRDALQTMGATRLQVIRQVFVPGALPSIITGMRLGVGYGWRALIAGEMVVAAGGLGFLIFHSRLFGQTDRIIAGMVTIGILYIAIDRLVMRPFENLTVTRWMPADQSESVT